MATNNQNAVSAEPKKITRDELKAMGLAIARKRKPIELVNTGNVEKDGATNGKRIGKRMLGDAMQAYKRMYRLADGQVSREKTSYPVSLSDQQIDYMEKKLADLHSAVFEALRSGKKPSAGLEDFPE